MISSSKSPGEISNWISNLLWKKNSVPTFQQDLPNQKARRNNFCSFPARRMISTNFPARKDLDFFSSNEVNMLPTFQKWTFYKGLYGESDSPSVWGKRREKHIYSNRALQKTSGVLSHIARWENWYKTGNFGQERLWGSSAATRSDRESIFQQQFGEYHGVDGTFWQQHNR